MDRPDAGIGCGAVRQVQKIQKELLMRQGEFDRIAENLLARGFGKNSDKKEGAPMLMGMSAGSFSRSFSGFELVIGANQAGIDMGLLSSGSRDPKEFTSVGLWARYHTPVNRNITLLPLAMEPKSHFITGVGISSEQSYVADLAPHADAALIIRKALALDEVIARLKADDGFGDGMDSKELLDLFQTALADISQRNRFITNARAYLAQFLEGCSKKFGYEIARARGDRDLVEAMENVADK